MLYRTQEEVMVERRNTSRRQYVPIAQFPLKTGSGRLVLAERRTLPTRRVTDIEVNELSSQELIAGLS
jgi:hypothetical protein